MPHQRVKGTKKTRERKRRREDFKEWILDRRRSWESTPVALEVVVGMFSLLKKRGSGNQEGRVKCLLRRYVSYL